MDMKFDVDKLILKVEYLFKNCKLLSTKFIGIF